jgi:hypothetical protein
MISFAIRSWRSCQAELMVGSAAFQDRRCVRLLVPQQGLSVRFLYDCRARASSQWSMRTMRQSQARRRRSCPPRTKLASEQRWRSHSGGVILIGWLFIIASCQ